MGVYFKCNRTFATRFKLLKINTLQLFYTTHIDEKYAYLPEIEARHAVQVLRKKIGDTLHFVDGQGSLYQGIVSETGKKKCVLEITEQQENYQKRPVHLHIGVAPTKNIDRIEWFLEKATEIGITEVTPLLCQRSERKRIRIDRLEKIALSAMKQSLKAYLPKINELTPFNKFIQQIDNQTSGVAKYIAHCADDDKKQLLQRNYTTGSDVCILIGPEGDFSPQEVELSFQHDFSAVSLGTSRLRTETAGLVAVHTIAMMNEG